MAIAAFWCIQTNPASRPSMSKVLEMLETDVELLEMPPKPFQLLLLESSSNEELVTENPFEEPSTSVVAVKSSRSEDHVTDNPIDGNFLVLNMKLGQLIISFSVCLAK
ncbi:hypothetical protein CRYUN_Cryun38cG0028800 [Craigia yunnanensis]